MSYFKDILSQGARDPLGEGHASPVQRGHLWGGIFSLISLTEGKNNVGPYPFQTRLQPG